MATNSILEKGAWPNKKDLNSSRLPGPKVSGGNYQSFDLVPPGGQTIPNYNFVFDVS